ncbi:MAG: ASCH domain-containing protein [Patescibacteria group bacterium]
MDHVAIMKKSWGLTRKILTGEKKIESRWYKTKRKPWNCIKSGDTVYFKDSGEKVVLKAKAGKVIQISNLSPVKVKEILKKYGKDDGIGKKDIPKFYGEFKNKNYCILVFLKNPVKIKPFDINKRGFGLMSAWITIPNISKIKI